MKKVLTVVRIVALSLLIVTVVLVLYNSSSVNGNFDFRFSSKKYSDYQAFYPGVYTCGTDLTPGSYDVIVRGMLIAGIVSIYKNKDEYHKHGDHGSQIIAEGSTGFHFSIEDGEVIEVDFTKVKEMKYKKVN